MKQSSEAEAPETTWLLAGAFVVLLGLTVRNAWVTEDAYITLRSIDNWVHGYGLRWNVDERVQSYTHPLWMLLLSALYFVTREAYGSALVLGLLVSAGAALMLARLARSRTHAVLALGLLALSRSYLDYSTGGLENPLTHLLVAAFVYTYVRQREELQRLALLTALIALNRTDAAVLVMPALVHASVLSLRQRGLRATIVPALIGFSPYLAWELFSLFYYGFLFPNTAYAKLNTGLPKLEMATQGLSYVIANLSWDLPLLPIVGLGVALGFSTRRLGPSLLALGVLLYLAYVVRVGGDFMHGRFLTLPLFGAVCLLAISELPLERHAQAALLLLPLPLLFWHPSAQEVYNNPHLGIVDERAFYRDGTSLMMFTRTRSLPNHFWVDEGLAMRAQSTPMHLTPNVGIKGYYAGPEVYILDILALTDPLLARLPARYDPHWRVGHYLRHVPAGYPETIQQGSCRMVDANLCTYYDKLKEVVSGDLWSWNRLKTVILFQFGAYDHLIDRERYLYPELAHTTLAELTPRVAEGSPWNGPGARVFGTDGLEIALPKPSHAKQLQVALDGNDTYLVQFKQGARLLAELESSPVYRPQINTRTFKVPELARKDGFDHIVLRPRRGDGWYSAAYVRLTP